MIDALEFISDKMGIIMGATLGISVAFSRRILMNKKSHIFRTALIFIVFSLAVVLTACKTEDVTKRWCR